MDYLDLMPILREVASTMEHFDTASYGRIKEALKKATLGDPALHEIASNLTIPQIRELLNGLS